MYVITTDKNVIINISETLDYQSNGNPLVNDGKLAIAKYLVKEIYENIEVPEEVCENKYCYTPENGFYKNPDWVEYFSDSERISALEDAFNSTLGF